MFLVIYLKSVIKIKTKRKIIKKIAKFGLINYWFLNILYVVVLEIQLLNITAIAIIIFRWVLGR